MPDNRNTNADSPPPDIPLDAEDWDVVFAPFIDHPYAALNLAYHLARLKQLLNGKLSDIPEAIAAIDRAIDRLYEHSEFRNVGYGLFRQTVEGVLTADTEKTVHKLGIRTHHRLGIHMLNFKGLNPELIQSLDSYHAGKWQHILQFFTEEDGPRYGERELLHYDDPTNH